MEVTIIAAEHSDFAELDAVQVESGGQSVAEWQGHGVYLRLEPATMYTYARDPGRYSA